MYIPLPLSFPLFPSLPHYLQSNERYIEATFGGSDRNPLAYMLMYRRIGFDAEKSKNCVCICA